MERTQLGRCRFCRSCHSSLRSDGQGGLHRLGVSCSRHNSRREDRDGSGHKRQSMDASCSCGVSILGILGNGTHLIGTHLIEIGCNPTLSILHTCGRRHDRLSQGSSTGHSINHWSINHWSPLAGHGHRLLSRCPFLFFCDNFWSYDGSLLFQEGGLFQKLFCFLYLVSLLILLLLCNYRLMLCFEFKSLHRRHNRCLQILSICRPRRRRVGSSCIKSSVHLLGMHNQGFLLLHPCDLLHL
mmetsp:Transcript_1910/g.3059  ORF Transcript_1910/g.3059 Transcript_1910/m.3059 type:complete len:241 (-) Transcript_1910:157-879(-)